MNLLFLILVCNLFSLNAMERPSKATEILQGFGGNLADELLRDLQKKTEKFSLVALQDADVKKYIEAMPLKDFFAFGLIDAFIQHAATSWAMIPFAYELPYASSDFLVSDLPICLNRGDDFVELYRLDTMKTTGKMPFDSDYTVLFSPNRTTFCVWNSESCVVFNAADRFAYQYSAVHESARGEQEKGHLVTIMPDRPIVAAKYVDEASIFLQHPRDERSSNEIGVEYTREIPHDTIRLRSEAYSADGHYYARICGNNGIEIISSCCKKGSVSPVWHNPYSVTDIIWPSYDMGILMRSRDGQHIVTLTTRVAYLLSRYKKITAAYSSSSFSTNTNS